MTEFRAIRRPSPSGAPSRGQAQAPAERLTTEVAVGGSPYRTPTYGDLVDGALSVIREYFVDRARIALVDDTYGSAPIPSLDGGIGRHGQRYQSVWLGIFRRTWLAGVDPLTYIDFCCRPSGDQMMLRYVPPRQMLTKELFGLYLNAEAYRRDEITRVWRAATTAKDNWLRNDPTVTDPSGCLAAIVEHSALAAYMFAEAGNFVPEPGSSSVPRLLRHAAWEYAISRRDYAAMGFVVSTRLQSAVAAMSAVIHDVLTTGGYDE